MFRTKSARVIATEPLFIFFTVLAILLPLAGARGQIGKTIATYELPPENAHAWGLAYCTHFSRPGVYVADHDDDRLYAYLLPLRGVGSRPEQLERIKGEDIDTALLDPAFVAPRGLAFGVYETEYLYAVTSNDFDGDGYFDSRLWRIDLRTLDTEWVNLNALAFGIRGKEVFGLAYTGGCAYISYDTSDLPTVREQVRNGILKLRVLAGRKPSINWWSRARAGNRDAVVAHMPASGREIGGRRAPSYGLATMALSGYPYLWATSGHSKLYSAQDGTGRGIFCFDTPGEGYARGLAYGGSMLYAVDRGNGVSQIHKIRVASDYEEPFQGPRHVRRLRMRLKNTARPDATPSGLEHNFALIQPNTARPNQARDSRFEISIDKPARTRVLSYDPAGDASSRQQYVNVAYQDLQPGEAREAVLETDFWISSSRHFVYPHLCRSRPLPAGDYTADCKVVYRMSDRAAYDVFIDEVTASMRDEYGASAEEPGNPYWTARNVLEFFLENYTYGNTRNPDVGHYSYNPVNHKLRLALDADPSDNKMTCSTAAHALAGVCRYRNVPARWIGTARPKGEWDSNGDGYMRHGEITSTSNFHRWTEVWLGETYGWQRFDATPYDGSPEEVSQYKLMQKVARGVGHKDLVLTVGSGYHAPFYIQKRNCQGYNSVARYVHPDSWYNKDDEHPERVITDHVFWQNACFITVRGPIAFVGKPDPDVEWTVSGRWDLDPDATVSIYLQPLHDDGRPQGDRLLLESGIPHDAGAHPVDLSPYSIGLYRFDVEKDGDPLTGDRGEPFAIVFECVEDFNVVRQGGTVRATYTNHCPGVTLTFKVDGRPVTPTTEASGSATIPVPCGNGIHNVCMKVTYEDGSYSTFCDQVGSPPCHTQESFLRGDVNGDLMLDVSDAITILRTLFSGLEIDCLDSADTDDTGDVVLTDAVYSLNFLFRGGPAPAEPFPTCGLDPTADNLTCESFSPCSE